MIEKSIKIFSDFDGTITIKDVGDTMFETFGGKQCLDFIELYREERISAVKCFQLECEACGSVDKKELDDFLDSQVIDESYLEFVIFCNEHGFSHSILSDGMDYYIQRILDNNSVGNVPFYSNKLEFIPIENSKRVRFKPSFPYTDEVCDRCACCKRNIILTMSSDEDVIIYIGEGYSDRCPARYADIVFAKDELLRYCQQENISFFEYKSFGDIQRRIMTLLDSPKKQGKNGIRKRRQAELARREVYIGG
jgi:2-hydroxy-3-keto-5-methylthiopentenyl-1-phosphate phosphatase